MANILNTESVIVYPSTRRANTDVDSRLISEKNFVGIINKLVDKEGFIISKKEDLLSKSTGYADKNAPIEFNIYGYYFKVAKMGEILDLDVAKGSNLGIYAYIQLDNTNPLMELRGIDQDGKYTGLVISPTVPTDANTKYLQLFERTYPSEDLWMPCEDSFIKFDQASIVVDIDGGEF